MEDVDVVVLGSGATGLTAAPAALGIDDSRDEALTYLSSLSLGLIDMQARWGRP